MDVQLHCVIKKGFSWREKKKNIPKQRLLTQYEWNIKREQLFLCRDHEKIIAYCILWIFQQTLLHLKITSKINKINRLIPADFVQR